MSILRFFAGPTALLAVVFLAATARAEPVTLSEQGTRLAPVEVVKNTVSVAFEIALGADSPTASYVSARTGDGTVMQRTNLGYWVPWDGRLDQLIDNHAPVAGGVMSVKVFKDEDLSDELFPIRLTIAYETASSFKFGVVELVQPGTH